MKRVGQVRLWEDGEHWCVYVITDSLRWSWLAVVLASDEQTSSMWIPGKEFEWADDDSILLNSKELA